MCACVVLGGGSFSWSSEPVRFSVVPLEATTHYYAHITIQSDRAAQMDQTGMSESIIVMEAVTALFACNDQFEVKKICSRDHVNR